MSDTPRTDAAEQRVKGPNAWDPQDTVAVPSSFARRLELELKQVTAYNAELVALNDHHAFVRERNDWTERWNALQSVRYHLDIKLNAAQRDIAAIEAGLSREYQAGDKRSGDLIDDFTEFMEHHKRVEIKLTAALAEIAALRAALAAGGILART